MIRITLIILLFCTTIAFSQQKTFEKEVQKISNNITEITSKEKDSLKKKVLAINLKLEKGKLSKKIADSLKIVAAVLHASNIEKKVSIQEQKLQQLVQDKTNGKILEAPDATSDGFKLTVFDNEILHINTNKRKKKKIRNRRTTTQFIFGLGLNNILINNDFSTLDNSSYKFWQSHFYEVGFSFKTRLTKRPSSAYFKYGFSFLWNNLRPKNNQYHIINENTTALAIHEEVLNESRFRHVQLNFPLHLELDFSKNKKYKDGFVKNTVNESFRLGLGGFIGVNIGTRQYLEYTNSSNIAIEELQHNNFNTNTFTYGLSTYVAYKSTGLYLKYDLNPLFKNTESRNISLGLRFDFE